MEKGWSRERLDLTGQRFGKLVVLHETQSEGRRTRWVCLCDCGRQHIALTQSLRSGQRSCGCARRQARPGLVTHGLYKTRIYYIWGGMISRSPVNDPRVLEIYQGPGTHDPAWDDFATFAAWSAENGYAPDLSLDRIDNSRGYWPDNCRWADKLTQANNKTTNVTIEVDGQRYTLAEAKRAFGVVGATIKKRLARGWPIHEAVKKLTTRQAILKNLEFRS